MINARSLATLGFGFGAVAIATIGFLAPVEVQAEVTQRYGGSGAHVAVVDKRKLTVADVNAAYDYLALREANRVADAAKLAAEAHKALVAATAKDAAKAASALQVAKPGKTKPGETADEVAQPTIDPALLMSMFDEFF